MLIQLELELIFAFIRQNQSKIILRQQTFYNLQEAKISIYYIYIMQYLFLNESGRRFDINGNIVSKSY